MNFQNSHYRIVLLLVLGFFTSVSSFAGEANIGKSIVTVRTFDVQAQAEAFMEMLDRAVKIARKLNPGGTGKTRVIAGNIAGDYAHLITVLTTYPNLEDYAKAEEAYRGQPELEAIYAEMQRADFTVIHTSYNTLVAEY